MAVTPAYADSDNLPAWPFVLVFLVLFFVVFVIPNTIFKGERGTVERYGD